jgi:LPS-assembly protein
MPVRFPPFGRSRLHDHLQDVVAHGLGALLLVLLLCPAPAGAQPRGPLTIRAGGQEATVLADEIQQIGGPNDLLIAVGNVEITQGESRLLADRVELNKDTGEAVAQGRVVFFDGQDRLVGDRVDYNLKTRTGVVYNASTFTAPYYRLSAERMDRIGPGLYNIHRGTFTTCEGDEPAWSFRMGTGTVALDDVAYGQNASFWLADKLPLVPWLPFFAAALRRERQSGFLFPEYGESSKKGFFAKIPYYWVINDSQDLTVSLDTFTRRGVGVEGEYRYILSQQARGNFYGFFIRETLRDDRDRALLDIPENRGFFSYRHDWQITPRLSFKIDANATTDDLVFREYGDALRDRARQRAETNVFLSQRWDTWSLVGNVLWYQDLTIPVHNELQRVPEIKLQGLRQPIPGVPYLQYETQASFTNFVRQVGDGGLRADLHPRVFLPVPVGGLFTITPFAGGRSTYYSRRAVALSVVDGVTIEDTIHEDRVRLQAEAGVDVETRASRVYEVGGAGGIDALQHVIEPRMQLLEIRGINQKALPQYDPDIDKIGRVNQVTYSITNRLNAKTVAGPGGEPVRWEMVRLVLSQTFNIRKAISQNHPFEDLSGDFIFQPVSFFRFRADATYDMYGFGFRAANTDVTATYRDVAVTLGSRFNDIAGANYVTAQVSARILSNLDGHVGVGYDVRNDSSVENRVGIDWRFQCFAISAEYVNRHRDENEFRFSISLLGIGQAGTKVGR